MCHAYSSGSVASLLFFVITFIGSMTVLLKIFLAGLSCDLEICGVLVLLDSKSVSQCSNGYKVIWCERIR